MKNIEDTLSDLFEKRERANDLYGQLEHSLALQKLCPTAFEHGTCAVAWGTDEFRGPVFQISRSDDSTITFPFDDVPELFKLEEASKRDITGHLGWDRSRARNTNDPVGQSILKFMRLRRRRGVVDG